jgi:8-oxo-dGTP pyrophosphatase MutT (NUDIX family)
MRQLREKIGHDLILMPSVTILTFDEKERVLLVRHSEGDVWIVPGGSIDPLEQPVDAAVREMWEETGLLIEPTRILGVYGGPEFYLTYRNGDQVNYVMTVFEGRVTSGSLQPDAVEILELGYFSEEELQDLVTVDWVKMVLADVFRNRKIAHFRPPTWRPPDDK